MVRKADFDAEPRSLPEVRRFVAETLEGEPRRDDIVLTASELAANVVRHARTSYTVRITTADHLVRLEVADGSSVIPAVEDLADSQWGLRMISRLSDRWGVDATDTGKTVWVEFAASSEEPA